METDLEFVRRMIAYRWSGAGQDERRLLLMAETAAQEDQRSEDATTREESQSSNAAQSSDHHTTADDLLRECRVYVESQAEIKPGYTTGAQVLLNHIDAHLNRKEV
jgi:hypothetical protein